MSPMGCTPQKGSSSFVPQVKANVFQKNWTKKQKAAFENEMEIEEVRGVELAELITMFHESTLSIQQSGSINGVFFASGRGRFA